MNIKFRTLRSDEIEVRVDQTRQNKQGEYLADILLYKNARVDMNILDETVGPMNWERKHEIIGENNYCTVSIWDDERKMWISKMDVGAESNFNSEKGQASDALKRACTCWGIGRELASSGRLTITLRKDDYYISRSDKVTVTQKFYVKNFKVNEKTGKVTSYTVVDQNGSERAKFNARRSFDEGSSNGAAEKTAVSEANKKLWETSLSIVASSSDSPTQLLNRLLNKYTITLQDFNKLLVLGNKIPITEGEYLDVANAKSA